jgi:hypothetical protein
MKALQGWRAFIGEVGVIVLGVLIALVAQQLVEEDLHSRSEVAGFRNVLRDELSIDLGTYQYRAKQEACISARLNQLQQLTLGVPGIRFKSAVCGIPVSRTIAPASGMGRAPTCWRRLRGCPVASAEAYQKAIASALPTIATVSTMPARGVTHSREGMS